MESSPYFDILDRVEIKNISDLLDLNKPKNYSWPGILPELPDVYLTTSKDLTNSLNSISCSPSHITSGLFRGQSVNWPLIPSAYRKLKETIDKNSTENSIKYSYAVLNGQLKKFSQIASQQNAEFPKSKIDQMIIATNMFVVQSSNGVSIP